MKKRYCTECKHSVVDYKYSSWNPQYGYYEMKDYVNYCRHPDARFLTGHYPTLDEARRADTSTLRGGECGPEARLYEEREKPKEPEPATLVVTSPSPPEPEPLAWGQRG